MMNKGVMLVCPIVLLALAGLLLYGQHFQMQAHALTGELAASQDKLRQQTSLLQGKEQVLSKYREQAQRNAELSARQTQTLLDITHSRARLRAELARQVQENEAYHLWRAARLPQPIIRMHNRPLITGAAGYQAWLSETGAVSAAGQSAD